MVRLKETLPPLSQFQKFQGGLGDTSEYSEI